jgi:23S rRNA (adenine2503-C2)-methyltransferase
VGIAIVLAASIAHARTTGLAPMWAVTMLSGVNDTPDDDAALAALAREHEAGSGKRPRISLVPYNRLGVADDPLTPSNAEAEVLFRETLRDGGFGAHKRYSGGGDVAAACGQLSVRAMPRG